MHQFECVGSTNQVAWELAATGASSGTTVIAERQEAGRGQWGRTWQSPPGGLYLSVLVRPPALNAAEASQLTLASAWGIATALRALGIAVRLKWPNDLLLDGRKLGGILTETRLSAEQVSQAVIGVGLNWHNPVPETGVNLATFPDLSLMTLATAVLCGLEQGYSRLEQEQLDALVPEYLGLLSSLGARVRWAGQNGTVTGVSRDGELCLSLGEPDTAQTVKLKPGAIRLGYSGSENSDTVSAVQADQSL